MATQGTNQAALLVVDMQRWSLGVGQEILAEVNNTIGSLRGAGIPVIFTQQGLKDPKAEARSNVYVQKAGLGACQQIGGLGWELMPGLDHTPDDLFLTSKTTYDAFYNTELLYVLLELKVDTVIICGVMSNTSCETTARSAFTQNFSVVFCSNGTAASDARMHDATLKSMLYGFAEVSKCNVVRSRFQTKWLTKRLTQRRIELAAELPPRDSPPSSADGGEGPTGLVAGIQALRQDSRASTTVDQEDEGWWLKTRRGKGIAVVGVCSATSPGGGSLFSKMASQRQQQPRGDGRGATSPFANTGWMPPTRRARLEAQMECARQPPDRCQSVGPAADDAPTTASSPPGRFTGLTTADELDAAISTQASTSPNGSTGAFEDGLALVDTAGDDDAGEGSRQHGPAAAQPARGQGPVQYFFFPAVKPRQSASPAGSPLPATATTASASNDNEQRGTVGHTSVASDEGRAATESSELPLAKPASEVTAPPSPLAAKHRGRPPRVVAPLPIAPDTHQEKPSGTSNTEALHRRLVESPAPPAVMPPSAPPPTVPARDATSASRGSPDGENNVRPLIEHRVPRPPDVRPPPTRDPARSTVSGRQHADENNKDGARESMPAPPAHPPPVPRAVLAHINPPQRLDRPGVEGGVVALADGGPGPDDSSAADQPAGGASTAGLAEGGRDDECAPPVEPPPPLRRLPDQGQIPALTSTTRSRPPRGDTTIKKRPGRRREVDDSELPA